MYTVPLRSTHTNFSPRSIIPTLIIMIMSQKGSFLKHFFLIHNIKTRQLVAVQREGGIPVGNKIPHPYQNP